jgi:hypothetical protein
MIWQQLATPAVRDLAWACFSPPLLCSARLTGPLGQIGNCRLELTEARQAFLRQLDQQPDALHADLADAHSTRLGIYFEKLWHFMLRADPDIELVAHNLPVRENGRTLGEYDIIYFCRQRQVHVHLELAVKFYLETATRPYWLGPGRRDSLEQKTQHLLSRQIILSRTRAGSATLGKLGVHQPITEIELKGYLFSQSQRPPLPDGYNHADKPLSQWHDWQTFLQQTQTIGAPLDWLILPRRYWLAPCDRTLAGYRQLAMADEVALRGHFEQQGQPLLLAGCDCSGQEQQRCFVTPLHWPGN